MPLSVLSWLVAAGAAVFAPAAVHAQARCDRPFADVFEEASPSVVSIVAFSIDPFRLHDRVVGSYSSGIVIAGDGLILTNSHAVFGKDNISVTFGDRGTLPAKLLGADPILDLAVLRVIEAGAPLPVARLGDSDRVRVGEDVMAVGYPFGLGQSATRGAVSAVKRVLPRSPMSWLAPFIQVDAAINPGNSGGALLDRCGTVIGINTVIIQGAENIGFAVPINIALPAARELTEKGRVVRPWHGVNGRLVDLRLFMLLNIPLVPGVLVETVEPGSPAEKIGLRGGTLPIRIGPEEYLVGGDIITTVNGERLLNAEQLTRLVRSLKVGDKIAIEFFRDGTIETAEIVLPERPILPGDLPPPPDISRAR